VGKQKRRLTPRETARLQGFPDSYSFAGQKDAATYKQTGNSVNIGVVWFVMKKHAERDSHILQEKHPQLYSAITNAPEDPYKVL